MPAYEADLFGAKYISAIHGRMMFFMAAASISGPMLLLKLRSISEKEAVLKLLENVRNIEYTVVYSLIDIVQFGTCS